MINIRRTYGIYYSHNEGAYVVQDQLPHVYGMSDRVFLLGEVHCVGNEPELLECSHTSIGVHSCGRDATSIPDDIIISCRGM